MPFVDVPGSVGTASPAHIASDVPKLNVVVTYGFTVTVKVVPTVQACPAEGVKVYVPEFWSSIEEGLHVPVTPLFEVVTRLGTGLPIQMVIDVPKLKSGVMIGLTVTLKFTVSAH